MIAPRRLSEDADRLAFQVNGVVCHARVGETVGAALLAMRRRAVRVSDRGSARGMYCGMGICQECRVTIDGLPNVRACMTPVTEGMRVEVPEGVSDGG
jgi:sarcosine oxidase subunit alpha